MLIMNNEGQFTELNNHVNYINFFGCTEIPQFQLLFAILRIEFVLSDNTQLRPAYQLQITNGNKFSLHPIQVAC